MSGRITRFLTAMLVVLLAAGVLQSDPVGEGPAAPPVADVVRARVIELVDDAGQVRASLTADAQGEAVLRLRDQQGQIRVKLGASAEGSGLLLTDGRTEPAVHMLAKTGSTTVTLAQQGQDQRVITP